MATSPQVNNHVLTIINDLHPSIHELLDVLTWKSFEKLSQPALTIYAVPQASDASALDNAGPEIMSLGLNRVAVSLGTTFEHFRLMALW